MTVRNRYAKGYRNERKTIKLFTDRGYIVMRSGGSHGPWDLVALDPVSGGVVLVQCKTNRPPVTLSEDEVKSYHPEWSLVYVVWYDYARKPRVINAKTGDNLPLWS